MLVLLFEESASLQSMTLVLPLVGIIESSELNSELSFVSCEELELVVVECFFVASEIEADLVFWEFNFSRYDLTSVGLQHVWVSRQVLVSLQVGWTWAGTLPVFLIGADSEKATRVAISNRENSIVFCESSLDSCEFISSVVDATRSEPTTNFQWLMNGRPVVDGIRFWNPGMIFDYLSIFLLHELEFCWAARKNSGIEF